MTHPMLIDDATKDDDETIAAKKSFRDGFAAGTGFNRVVVAFGPRVVFLDDGQGVTLNLAVSDGKAFPGQAADFAFKNGFRVRLDMAA